jgi:hypothetical protein
MVLSLCLSVDEVMLLLLLLLLLVLDLYRALDNCCVCQRNRKIRKGEGCLYMVVCNKM